MCLLGVQVREDDEMRAEVGKKDVEKEEEEN